MSERILAQVVRLGEPADNAGRFVSWLKQLEGNGLYDVKYCGRVICLYTAAHLTHVRLYSLWCRKS